MDALTSVHARISEIQARFMRPTTTAATGGGTSAASWASAAQASGLTTGAASPGLGASASASGNRAVSAAQQYLGVPYRWGGTDPATGLACSGFTQRVYADLGIAIPRTSSQQATAGSPVASLDEARPGDLVFFDNSSGRPGIDHVGLYIGDGKMIAAPQEGDVVKVQSVGNPSVIRRMSPSLESTGSLSTGPVASPLAGGSVRGVPYSDLFTTSGTAHGVSPALLAAVARTESSFVPSAVSSAGAQGLMQFMPATARGLGIDPLDPRQAVDGAARYLRQLQDQFGSTDLALAAYNAGPGTVRAAGGIPDIPETKAYVSKVLSTAAGYR